MKWAFLVFIHAILHITYNPTYIHTERCFPSENNKIQNYRYQKIKKISCVMHIEDCLIWPFLGRWKWARAPEPMSLRFFESFLMPKKPCNA